MKISALTLDRSEGQQIIDIWKGAAEQLSMEHGIFVIVQWSVADNLVPEHIWFEVMDHNFESLADLRKALNNKAFL